ncbi:MAG: histidine phosphatase family protein [Acidaminococcaceae bacterium]|nr:histidine phosphatase family protein [Acidaminococcaceae bacterium]MDD4721471.1 histidine phosphatase family protein [Acidaminococcaceae bacterium]
MIILVRHGEATHHTEHLTGGWTDSVLTAYGKQQIKIVAKMLAKDFAKHPKPIVFTSDLQRASASARIICKALGDVPMIIKNSLREKNNGKAAGLTEEEARKYYRKPISEKELDHANYEGGETRREFYNRTVKGFEDLVNTDENIIIVAHKGTLQNIVFSWLGMDIDEVNEKNFSLDVRPASISVLGINKWQEHAIFLLNDTSYLQKDSTLGLFNYKFSWR